MTGKARPRRSKTGCLTCRRRRVRCDERKPTCGACDRLTLNCSFDRAVVDFTATSKYRVRFVNSPYNSILASSSSSRAPAGSGGGQRANVEDDDARPQHVVPESPGTSANDSSDRITEYDFPGPRTTTAAAAFADASAESQQPLTPSSISSPSTARASAGLVPRQEQFVFAQDAGIVPPLLDFDWNFDLLDQWMFAGSTSNGISLPGEMVMPPNQHHQPPMTTTSSGYVDTRVDAMRPELSGDIDDSPTMISASPLTNRVVIDPEDQQLVQHYMDIMTGYVKIRQSANDDIYSQIFTNMALFYAPLYHAIMAWTCLHLSQTDPASRFNAAAAERRYRLAIALLHADDHFPAHFEKITVTIWLLLQYELLAARDVDRFAQHLEYAADLVDARRTLRRSPGTPSPPPLSPIGARVLVWLGSYDVRAAYAGAPGRLLQNLEALRASEDFVGLAFPRAAIQSNPGLVELEACLRLILDLDTVEIRVLSLARHGPDTNATTTAATLASIRTDLLAIRRRTEADPLIRPALEAIADPTRTLGGKLTTKQFNRLLLLASYYSVLIVWRRLLRRHAPNNQPFANDNDELVQAEEAATRAIRIALWVRTSRPPSPQTVWPRILMTAATEVRDAIYRAWVLEVLREAEGLWGSHFGRVGRLIRECVEEGNGGGVNECFSGGLGFVI